MLPAGNISILSARYSLGISKAFFFGISTVQDKVRIPGPITQYLEPFMCLQIALGRKPLELLTYKIIKGL